MHFMLNVPDFLIILIFSVIISGVNIISYRFIGNYEALKAARNKMNKVTEEMKKGKTTDEHMKRFSEAQSEYMKHSIKPMMVSLVLIMLLFPFFTRAMGDSPIINNTAIVDGKNITITSSGKLWTISYENKTIQTDGLFTMNNRIYNISKDRVKRVIIVAPLSIPLIGNKWGWLATYLITVLIVGYLMKLVTGVRL